MSQLGTKVLEETPDEAAVEIKDDIKSLLDETEDSNLFPDDGSQNLEEVLEKRRSWKDYGRGESIGNKNLFGIISLPFYGSMMSEVLGFTEEGLDAAGIALPSTLLYLIAWRGNNKRQTAQEHIDEIDDSLDNCYLFESDYDLTKIGGEVIDTEGSNYQDLVDLSTRRRKAKKEAITELSEKYPSLEGEDDWSSFVEDENYGDGLQVLWIDEKKNESNETDAFEWKIEFYDKEGSKYNLVHESFGASTSEKLEKVKKNGEQATENIYNLENMFNITNTSYFEHPRIKYRFRRPT